MLAAALFCGCDKDDVPCPVTEISVPASSAENPVQPGSSVTIKGKGFTDTSEIWLRGTDHAAEVHVEITDISTASLTFTAPEVSGEQNVILKQDGGEWSLGKLYFVELDGILPKKLVKIVATSRWDEDTYTETCTTKYTYDEKGRLSKIDMVDEDHSVYEIEYTHSVYEIEYTANEITMRINGEHEKWHNVFSLKNGRAATCVEVETEADYKHETEYSYGSNSYLSGFVCKKTDEESSDSYKGTLTFGEGGYLKTYDVKQVNFEAENYIPYSIEFTPNKNVRNNLNLDLMGCSDFMEEIEEEAIVYAYLLGIGGKRTTYLPQQLTLIEGDEVGNSKYIIKYDYKFNGDYLSEILMDVSEDGYYLTMKLYYEE